MKNKFTFYLLSFPWGLPMTLIGCVVAAILMIGGKKPVKYGWCWCFEIGAGWGGVELGPVFLVSRTAGESTKKHEVGHAIQNVRYGVLMPFIVCIPSAVRYWYRKLRKSISHPCTTAYSDIWFEAEADRLGAEAMSVWSDQ